MMNLIDIAFDNLVFLNDKENFLANRYKISNQRFIKETEDDDNTIYSPSDLEYPIFFTFHQLMNHIHSSYKPTFHGKTKKELLDMFVYAIDIIEEYYIETDNSNKDFERLLDDIDDKVFFIQQYYKYGWCHCFPTFIKGYLNTICRLVIETSKEINGFNYIFTDSDDDDGDDGDDDDGDDDDDDDNDDGDQSLDDLDETNHNKHD